jgi:hypothetical protein
MDETEGPSPTAPPWGTPPASTAFGPLVIEDPVVAESEAPAPRRRTSRWLIAAVVVAALLAVGAAVSLHRTTQDRAEATARQAAARSDLAQQQSTADARHDAATRARTAGQQLDDATTAPLSTIVKLNDLNRALAAAQQTQVQTGEQGRAGSDAYNQAVRTGNADADQGNALLDELNKETNDLPTL